MTEQMSPLRQRMIDDMTIRNMSPNTQKIYIRAVKNFSVYSRTIAGQADVRGRARLSTASRFARPPSRHDQPDHVRACGSSTARRSGKKDVSEHIPLAPQADTLPAVLARDEVVRFLKAVPDLEMRTIFITIYAAGLRVSEAVALTARRYRQRPHGHPRAARQGPQRSLRDAVRAAARHPARLLEARTRRNTGCSPAPIRRVRSQRAPCSAPAAQAADAAGLDKTVTVHTLRHSFATHLLEQGVDIRVIQDLLGHRHITSTTRYARVALNTIRQIQSPLDASEHRAGAAGLTRRLCPGQSWRWRISSAATARRGARPTPAHLSLAQRRVMTAIEICRTAALGGHVERCEDCAHTRIAYNSCRNRHCPKCQWTAAQAWLAAREAELLPVPYFHVVFTLPAADRRHRLPEQGQGLRPAVLGRGRDAHHDRSRSQASGRRDRLDRRAAHLGTEPRSSSACSLHRAGRRHLPRRRALGCDADPASSCRSACSRACSGVCSSKRLEAAHARASCSSSPISPASRMRAAFRAYLAPLRKSEWVVYAKRPFAGPAQVLAYLARYTHRVAIANSRLLDLDDNHVSFRWKDYRENGEHKARS